MGGHFYALLGRFAWLYTAVSLTAAALASGLALFLSPLAFALVALVVLLVIGQESAENLARRLGRAPNCAELWTLARWQALWALALTLPALALAALFLPAAAGVPWGIWLAVLTCLGLWPVFLFRLGMALARRPDPETQPGAIPA